MNNEDKIKEINATIEQLKSQVEELQKPKSNRWRAGENDRFEFVDRDGLVESSPDHIEGTCGIMYDNGNYFKTKEEAEASLKYHVMNSEYDYWHIGFGIPKPDFEPKGVEYFYDVSLDWWKSESRKEGWSNNRLYRWKRSEQ